MALYFLDSSAIVKRYFQEPGHEWIEMLHDPAQGHGLYIAQAALVEVVASICRKAREQNMPREDVFVAHPPDSEPPDYFFVSADLGLLTIARSEGFRNENPNNYS